MNGKVVLITGGTSGIGFETAVQLGRMGARILITSRDMEKGARVCCEIAEKSGNPDIGYFHCRLDSFRSIRDFAARFLAEQPQLHVLINNAGVWETRRMESEDGIEMTLAVNHLAPFMLTGLLLPLLKASAPARIITVASEAHRNTDFDFEDPGFLKRSYPMMTAYNQSKLANILFTRHLTGKLTGTGVTVNCLHPGVVHTPIFDKLNPFLKFFLRFYMISPERGAGMSVYLASASAVEGVSGAYYKKGRIVPGSSASRDSLRADKLWELSLRLSGMEDW